MEERLRRATVGAGVIILVLVATMWWRPGGSWREQFLANLFADASVALLGFAVIDWWFGLTKERRESEERRATANLVARYLMEAELVENRDRLESLHQIASRGGSGIRAGERYKLEKTSWVGLMSSGALLRLSIEALGHLRDAYAGMQKIERAAAEVGAIAQARRNWPDFVVQNVPEVQTSINFALRALGSPYAKKFTTDRH